MIGLGTLIDVTLILLGGFAGLAFGRFISERIQDTLLKATAVAIIFIGISGAMSGMLTVSGGEISAGGSALVVISLALGSLIGAYKTPSSRQPRWPSSSSASPAP